MNEHVVLHYPLAPTRWPGVTQYDQRVQVCGLVNKISSPVVILSHPTTTEPNQYPPIAQQRRGNRRQKSPLRNDAGPLAFLKLVLPGVDHFVVEIQGRFVTVLYTLITGCVCLWDNVSQCLDRLNEGQQETSWQCIIKWDWLVRCWVARSEIEEIKLIKRHTANSFPS